MTAVIAVFALVLSAFTFYWTSLRRRKSFYLVRLHELSSRMRFDFALVNGGKSDVLMTRISCRFDNAAQRASFYPEQRVTTKEGSGMLVPAGKAVHCTVEFTESFTSTFAQSVEPDAARNNLRVHPMSVDVQWIEMNGVLHERLVPHSQVGFTEEGEIRMVGPLNTATDLYRAAKNGPKLPAK